MTAYGRLLPEDRGPKQTIAGLLPRSGSRQKPAARNGASADIHLRSVAVVVDYRRPYWWSHWVDRSVEVGVYMLINFLQYNDYWDFTGAGWSVGLAIIVLSSALMGNFRFKPLGGIG